MNRASRLTGRLAAVTAVLGVSAAVVLAAPHSGGQGPSGASLAPAELAAQRALPSDVDYETSPGFWDFPACEVEDASAGPLPCMWDASSSGNGVGHSFYVTGSREPGQLCFTYVLAADQQKWGGCE